MQVGAKYESENEDDLKDQLDFTKPVEAALGLGGCSFSPKGYYTCCILRLG